jgi:hypothetical protein
LQCRALGRQGLLLVMGQSLFDMAHAFDQHTPEPLAQRL